MVSLDVKGFPSPGEFARDLSRIAVVSHGRGRLEVFGSASLRIGRLLAHTWQHFTDSLWTTVHYRGDVALGRPPVAALATAGGRDALVVAGISTTGELVTCYQTDVSDDAGWSPWEYARDLPSAPSLGPLLVAPQDTALHMFYIDNRGAVVLGSDVSGDIRPQWSFTILPFRVKTTVAPTAVAVGRRIWFSAVSTYGEARFAFLTSKWVPRPKRSDTSMPLPASQSRCARSAQDPKCKLSSVTRRMAG